MSLSKIGKSTFLSSLLIVTLLTLCAFSQPVSPAYVLATDTSGTTTSGTNTDTATTDTTDTTDTTTTAPAITIGKRSDPLLANGNFVDAVTIHTATTVDHVTVQVKDDSGALLYLSSAAAGTLAEGAAPAKKISVKPVGGIAKISILTKGTSSVPLRITPFDTTAAITDDATDVLLSGGSNTVDSLGSKLSYLQLFVGTTFTNNYDDTGKAAGFGSAGQLIRLTFDTLWPHQGKRPRAKDFRAHRFQNGSWHTDLNLEFSKFPFGNALNPPTTSTAPTPPPTTTTGTTTTGTTTTDTTGTNAKGLANAFSGAFGATWQPNRWAHYDKRDSDDIKPGDDFLYDAYRWGLFGRAGATTRSARAKYSHNSTIDRIQFGVRFAHTRSQVDSPEKENRDVEPIRFIEISYGRFSEFEGRPHASRVVIDGGLRLAALSNDVFPIYLGGHLNTGPGPDDLRVFIGVLMKLDKLGALVTKATAP
jgi:hypothetical protein